MSITVGKLFGNGTVLYQMKLLAGQKGLNNLVEWMHIIENDEVSEFLHGNEVVLTSGILNSSDGWLLEYTKKLHSVGTSAFIINLGPYTKSIPKEVIEYCNEVKMPLYTIPWETRMVDLTRDICYRIMQSEQVEISIASTIKNIIFKTGDLETLILQMERYGYLRDSTFCFIVMSFENKDDKELEFNINRIKLYSERIARSINELYISFSYKNCWVLALVNYSNYNVNNFVNTFFKNWNEPLWKIHMGVSENKDGIKVQAENFNNAFTAMSMARKKNKEVIFYEELDIHKLLLNAKDKEVLKEFYNETLGKLEKYDKENNTDLVNFLFLYLQNNGSQSLVAEKQYIHRNTVNNQLKKIEKITGYNPSNLEEKLRFYLGFYIKDVM
ncbi:PucR family transcriptional regulator [Clostridium chromiireducens]|uniref:PucR family transcriptional regulator n=1 Tax=Clostridium chromiireducens TaxID=225345 RepID=A0A399ISE8_9CLOT|nr:PucR family transcriptional regulator [Clostridium chromiireducens]MVX63237.1 PucR family transcriptional regulator [Clostridium chromiireducens]RII33866.1 PucR family transcriptional regulator [Clostridium chromiireducens]